MSLSVTEIWKYTVDTCSIFLSNAINLVKNDTGQLFFFFIVWNYVLDTISLQVKARLKSLKIIKIKKNKNGRKTKDVFSDKIQAMM